ncbi:MAG: hypothetical protein WBE25_04425 [Xanthobacteraceae bacterium]
MIIKSTAGTRPALFDVESLAALLADHSYPPPHPFAVILPRISAAGQEALTASIRQNGFHENETITVFDNKIADGIARCVSAIELGIPWEQMPKIQFEGDEAALLRLLIDKNVIRRHLNESQRAMVAARLATMRQGARTDRPQICGMSQPQAAELLNIGDRLVQHARVVLDRGVPELQEAVDSGILAVSAADTATKQPADQQRAMVVNALNQHNPAKAFGAAMRKAERQSHHGQIVANARLHDLSGRRYPISVAPERIVARQSDVCAVSKLGDCCIVSRHGHELHNYLPKVPLSGGRSRAKPSNSAPRNTPKCSSAVASPAPRRSCSICSMAIIC